MLALLRTEGEWTIPSRKHRSCACNLPLLRLSARAEPSAAEAPHLGLRNSSCPIEAVMKLYMQLYDEKSDTVHFGSCRNSIRLRDGTETPWLLQSN